VLPRLPERDQLVAEPPDQGSQDHERDAEHHCLDHEGVHRYLAAFHVAISDLEYPIAIRRDLAGIFMSISSSMIQTSALRTRCLVERGAQPLGELDRIVIDPEMQKEQPRLLVQCGCAPRSPQYHSHAAP